MSEQLEPDQTPTDGPLPHAVQTSGKGDAPSSPRTGTPDFAERVRLHGDRMYNFAYRLSGNAADAGDLVQEAFARAFQHQDLYDPVRPFDAWVARILRNVFLDQMRRFEHKHTVSMDASSSEDAGNWAEVLPGKDEDPSDEAMRKERDGRIQGVLNALPVDYRTAVTLCDVERLSYEDIARVMQCPVGTVRSRIHQGRLLMRKMLEGEPQ